MKQQSDLHTTGPYYTGSVADAILKVTGVEDELSVSSPTSNSRYSSAGGRHPLALFGLLFQAL